MKMTNKELLARDKRRTAKGNKNRVPVKQWRKWSVFAREVFNELYAHVHDNQGIVVPPGVAVLKAAHWKVVAWNVAWLAAVEVDAALPSMTKKALFTDRQIRDAVEYARSTPPRIAALRAGGKRP